MDCAPYRSAGTAGSASAYPPDRVHQEYATGIIGANGLPGSQVNRSSIGMSLSPSGLRLGVHLNQNARRNYGESCPMSSNTRYTSSLDLSYTNRFIRPELHEPRVHSDGSICERHRRRLQRLRHHSYDYCRVSQLVDLGSFGFRQP